LTVTEIFRHGQTGQGHAHTGSRRFVHLTKDQRSLGENAALAHLAPEVVALAGTLAHAGEDGVAAVFGGNVADQFLDQNGFADTGAAEQTDFAAAGIGSQQVNDLDTGFQNFRGRALFVKSRRVPVNGPFFRRVHRTFFVDGLAQDVEHTAQGGFAYRRFNGVAGGNDLV